MKSVIMKISKRTIVLNEIIIYNNEYNNMRPRERKRKRRGDYIEIL